MRIARFKDAREKSIFGLPPAAMRQFGDELKTIYDRALESGLLTVDKKGRVFDRNGKRMKELMAALEMA